MILSHPPKLVKQLYPSLLWEVVTEHPDIYLTFDDGPTPGVTDIILDLLAENNAKATFFCLGKNIKSYPDLFERILAEGHKVGNHTFNHRNGWKTKTVDFMKDVQDFENLYTTDLFRPPYGRLKPSQINLLKDKYKIVMWSILSMDYDSSISPARCIDIVLSKLNKGSIVVFHDSEKAKRNVIPTLKKALEVITEKELRCRIFD